jgi:hypothetical protein
MTFAFPSASMLAAAAVIAAVLAPLPSSAQGGPVFENRTLHTSDIQYRFTRSPDSKEMSVLFDNFAVAPAAGGGAGPAVRVLPLRIPVSGAGKGATLRVKVRGALACGDGAACLAVLWVNGHTQVLKLARDKASKGYFAEADFSLPGADVHQAAVILIAEREERRRRFFRRNEVAAMVSVDSLDFAIAPPAGAGGAKR